MKGGRKRWSEWRRKGWRDEGREKEMERMAEEGMEG